MEAGKHSEVDLKNVWVTIPHKDTSMYTSTVDNPLYSILEKHLQNTQYYSGEPNAYYHIPAVILFASDQVMDLIRYRTQWIAAHYLTKFREVIHILPQDILVKRISYFQEFTSMREYTSLMLTLLHLGRYIETIPNKTFTGSYTAGESIQIYKDNKTTKITEIKNPLEKPDLDKLDQNLFKVETIKLNQNE